MANEFIIRKGFKSLQDSQITGSLKISEDLEVLGSISGDITGSATTASYIELSNVDGSASLSSRISSNSSSIGSLNSVSGSYANSASFASDISANSASIASLEKISGSYANSASFASNISANSSSIGSLNAVSSSYLLNTTDTLTGDLTVTGNIIATTLNVQDVTASVIYSSGSNIFGSSSADTQQFTGSILTSGSIEVNGNKFTVNGATGNATFAGSITAAGGTMTSDTTFNSNIILEGNIFHKDDTNTYFGFNSGSSGDDTIVFATNNVQRLIIDSSGNSTFSNNVFIAGGDTNTGYDRYLKLYGNSDPATNVDRWAGLAVYNNGGNNVNELAFFAGSGDSARTEKIRITNSGDLVINNNQEFQSKDAAGTAARILYLDNADTLILGNPTTVDDIRFDVDTYGEGAMIIKSSGNVGIGVTGPGEKLEVNGNIRIYNSSNAPYIDFTESGAVTDSKARITMDQVDGSNGQLIFSTEGSGTLTERMRIRSDGGIAIGAGNAGYSSQILSVKSGTADSVFYGESTDANCFASFRDNSSTANIEYGAIGNNHVFRKDASEQMRITSGGDVCIGTTSPSSNNNYGTGDLNVENDTFASAQIFSHNSTAGNYSFLGIGKSSGTGASPTIVQAQETVGAISYYGYDGAAYQRLATISADVDGTPGAGDMPGRLEFSTTADGASAPTTRMVIGQQGVVTVGSAKRYVDSGNTQFDLEITEGMAFGGNAFTFATIQGDSAGNGNIEICANAYPANTGTESKITFKTSTSSGGQHTDALVIKGSNVGIGEPNPNYKLNVASGTNTDGIYLSGLGNAMSNGEYRQLQFGYSDTDTSFGSTIRFVVPDASSHGGQIEFYTDAGPGSTTALGTLVLGMFIDPRQNVGIGTNTIPSDIYTASGGGYATLKMGQSSFLTAYKSDDSVELCQNTYLKTNGTNQGITASVAAARLTLVDGSFVFATLQTAADKSQTAVNVMNITPTAKVNIGQGTSITGFLNIEQSGNHIHLRNGAQASGRYWNFDVASDSKLYILNEADTGVYIAHNATSWTANSDESLKENIKPLNNVLDKIKDYRCVEYNLKSDDTKGKKIGFIAQDWENDFAPIVDKDDEGLLGMKYTETIPVLLKAIQELKAEIEILKNK